MNTGLQSCLQIFPSAAFLATKEFYESIGFRAVCYLNSDQPHICLYRDSIEIILTKSKVSKIQPNREIHGYGYDGYFISNDQYSLYNDIMKKGVKIVKELRLTDYSNREFIFEDNEGRWIAIGCKEGSKEVLGLQLSHVAFYCCDVAAMERFYAELLELTRVRVCNQGKEDECIILGRDNVRIALYKKNHSCNAGDSSFKHFAIGINSMDNMLRQLSILGVHVESFVDYSQNGDLFKVCYVKDPENNTVQFMEGSL